MDDLLVVADDRTGALETAGALAARFGRGVTVGTRGAEVIDLGTRHLAPGAAREVWATLPRAPDAMKIDSTLRGGWADEVVAAIGHGRRAMVVAALPALGRTCEAGTVLVCGVPVAHTVAGRDRRHRVRWSRPAEHLAEAGARAPAVTQIADDAALIEWLAGGTAAIAVVDAADAADLERIGERWRAAAVRPLVVGTSAALAAALAAPASPPSPTLPVASAVLVVCASLHPSARRQLAALVCRADPADRVAVLVSEPLHRGAASEQVAAALAAAAHRALRAGTERALVVVGGDTAAAVLGDEVVTVRGTLADGAVWGVSSDGRIVVTRAGGFGDPRSLLAVVDALLGATGEATLCG